HYDVVANLLKRDANLAGNRLPEHGGRLEAGEEQRVADVVHDLAADFAFAAGVIGDLPILVKREQHFNFVALEAEGRRIDHGALGVEPVVDGEIGAGVGRADGE